jgi:hypothetical protein
MLTGREETGFFGGPAFESLPGRKFPPGSVDLHYQRKPALSLNRRGYVNMLPIVLSVALGL